LTSRKKATREILCLLWGVKRARGGKKKEKWILGSEKRRGYKRNEHERVGSTWKKRLQ